MILTNHCWVSVCVWPVMTDNCSDTSYESCSAAPDSNHDLRLVASCSLMSPLWCTNKTMVNISPPSPLRWSRKISRSIPRFSSRRIVWASPRPPRFDLCLFIYFLAISDCFGPSLVFLSCALRSEMCFCWWAGAGGQAQGHDGGLPSLQGRSGEDLPGTEERPTGTQRRWDCS